MRPAKTQISLGIRPVWSESSLSAWRNLWSLATYWALLSKDSDQNGQMPRLVWVFAGRTCHFVGFVMRWLTCTLLWWLQKQQRITCIQFIKTVGEKDGMWGFAKHLVSLVSLIIKLINAWFYYHRTLKLQCIGSFWTKILNSGIDKHKKSYWNHGTVLHNIPKKFVCLGH